MNLRTFEDLPVGTRFPLGPTPIDTEEMVAFAAEFDPQPFHLDPEAGRRSLLGGLAASGWYTLALLMRMTYDGFLHEVASMGSPGVEAVKWVRPVLAGDELSGVAEVTERRPSASRPQMGMVRFRFTLCNQRDETVLTQDNYLMVARRAAP